MKVFIAAPLFNEMERKRNSEIAKSVREFGFEVFVPQDDVGLAYDIITKDTKDEVRRQIFDEDMDAVRKSDIILILLDGRTPDEGACVELGVGWALGKICIGYKTDDRAMDKNGDNNIMIDGCLTRIVKTTDELRDTLTEVMNRYGADG